MTKNNFLINFFLSKSMNTSLIRTTMTRLPVPILCDDDDFCPEVLPVFLNNESVDSQRIYDLEKKMEEMSKRILKLEINVINNGDMIIDMLRSIKRVHTHTVSEPTVIEHIEPNKIE